MVNEGKLNKIYNYKNSFCYLVLKALLETSKKVNNSSEVGIWVLVTCYLLLEKKCGGVAQLGEHLPCKQGVSGSIPLISTTNCRYTGSSH